MEVSTNILITVLYVTIFSYSFFDTSTFERYTKYLLSVYLIFFFGTLAIYQRQAEALIPVNKMKLTLVLAALGAALKILRSFDLITVVKDAIIGIRKSFQNKGTRLPEADALL